MDFKNREYAYPVLNEDNDNYNTSIFDVRFKFDLDINNINLDFEFILKNKELEELIRNGDAEYVIHLECGITMYREILKKTISNNIKKSISINKINEKLEIVAFIICKNEIKNFRSDDFNEDYENLSFNFFNGNILAYKVLPSLNIKKNSDNLEKRDSYFKIVKKIRDDNLMDINIDSDYIKIGLNSKDFNLYAKFSKIEWMQPILNNMVILPALVYVFEDLKQEGNQEAYIDKNWFISLKRCYQKMGLNIEDEILENKTSFQLAQEIMEYPVGKSLTIFEDNFNIDDEEDI